MNPPMKTAYTPGPWNMLFEECDKPYIRIRGTQLGMRYKIANVLTPSYEGVLPMEAEETRANARLISAAPDLLEALEQAVTSMQDSGYPNDHVAVKAARQAIAKAKLTK